MISPVAPQPTGLPASTARSPGPTHARRQDAGPVVEPAADARNRPGFGGDTFDIASEPAAATEQPRDTGGSGDAGRAGSAEGGFMVPDDRGAPSEPDRHVAAARHRDANSSYQAVGQTVSSGLTPRPGLILDVVG